MNTPASQQPEELTPQTTVKWRLWVLWLLAGVSLFWMLGERPCQRTQEARVLVCAREMLECGSERWLLPTCNGELRLQKPPLPYWLSAGAFGLTGQVSETTGRLPAGLAAWLTLLLTYYAGAKWFSRKAGVIAAGMLLTSLLFYQYGRLAETDIYATLFVTMAVVFGWRALDMVSEGEAWYRPVLAFVAFGVATGGAFLAKGPPGVYPILFVPLLGILTRNWRGLLWWAVIGLPVALAIAAPWYMYVYLSGHWGVLARELAVVTRGDDHPGPFWELIIQTAQGTLPWTIICPVALMVAIRFRKACPQLVGIFCWLTAVYVPLAISVNKQLHYAMPAMPPLIILCGWALSRASDDGFDRLTRQSLRYCVVGMLVVAATIGAGLIVWSVLMSQGIYDRGTGQLHVALGAMGIVLLIGGLAGLVLNVRRGMDGGLAALIATLGVVMPVLFGPVSVNLIDDNTRDSGRNIAEHAGQGPIVASNLPSLPLVFALKRVIPVAAQDQLPVLARQDATVIAETAPGDAVLPLPEPWTMVWRGGPKGRHFQVFRPIGSATTK